MWFAESLDDFYGLSIKVYGRFARFLEWDRTEVRSRFLAAADNEGHNRYLLGTAISTGLMSPSELVENDDVLAIGQRLLAQRTVDQPITSISQLAFAIEVLADAGDLSPAEKDHLARRLMVTWNAMEKAPKDTTALEDADIITRLFVKLDQSPELAKRKTDVHRWLGQYQLTNTSVFTPSGGFLKYPSVRSSDASATESAVRLMQHYGGSENIDVLALRSFLRPKTDWGLLTDSEMARASTLQRLDQVPAISQPTAWDYLVRNQSLWFAMMLVGLCLYATLGAPNLVKQE